MAAGRARRRRCATCSTGAGHDAGAILAKLDDAKEDLRRRTDRAIALGIFGAPAFVVGGEMFWGQDRIEFVEKALTNARG